MSVLRVFDFGDPARNVRFDRIAPAGFRILGALDRTAKMWPTDLFITSATDGTHSGPTDPHALGEAYDVRSNNIPTLAAKNALVRCVIERLRENPDEVIFEVSGGFANDNFFGFVENPGGENEHIHVQRRKGMTYPPQK